jgi:hypothetical protein
MFSVNGSVGDPFMQDRIGGGVGFPCYAFYAPNAKQIKHSLQE